MATPRVAAGVLFRDDAGAVLLVKPTYKAGWDFPGGYVEPGESPKQDAQREVREELGFEADIGELLVVDWAPHPDEVTRSYSSSQDLRFPAISVLPHPRRSRAFSIGQQMVSEPRCRRVY